MHHTPVSWWRSPLWLGALGLFLFLPTLRYGFVEYDDPWLIRNNTTLHTLSQDNVRRVWFDLSTTQRLRLGGEYLPVRDMSVMLDYRLYGGWIGGYHLTNTLLYALLCALVGLALWRWTGHLWLSWCAGLLFTLHPVHVESVAWLSERKGLLCGVALLGAVLLFQRFVWRPGWWAWLGTACLLVLALWSKGVGVVGVAWLGVWLWCFGQTKGREGDEESRLPQVSMAVWLGWGALIVVCGLAFLPVWWTGQAANMVGDYHGGSVAQTAWLMLGVHAKYLGLSLGVGGYAIKYPIFPGQVPLWLGLLGAVTLVLIVVVAVLGLFDRRRWRWAALAAATWLIFLLPVSQVLFPLQNYIADRYLLLPSLGFCLAVAGLFFIVPLVRLRTMAVATMMFCWLLLTLLQIPTWSSTRALFVRALEQNPQSVTVKAMLIADDIRHRKFERAWVMFSKAYRAHSKEPRILLQGSVLLARAGRPEAAIKMLKRGLHDPKADKLRANLALFLTRDPKRWWKAYRYAQEAVKISPMAVHNQRVLGGVALRLYCYDQALTAFKLAMRLAPSEFQNLFNMANMYYFLGRFSDALSFAKRAAELRPGNPRLALLSQMLAQRPPQIPEIPVWAKTSDACSRLVIGEKTRVRKRRRSGKHTSTKPSSKPSSRSAPRRTKP